jgi:hypothetical protein
MFRSIVLWCTLPRLRTWVVVRRARLRTRGVVGRVRSGLTVAAIAAVAAVPAWFALAPGGVAQELLPSVSAPTDLVLLGLAGGQTPATVPVQRNPEPPLEATPRAVCGPGSHPLDGTQGRVPASAIDSPAAANGYSCNLSLIAHQGETGGFKVLRYLDPQGHECAYYDTTLLFPLNALRMNGSARLDRARRAART